jgi:hypothetical protein
LLPLVLVTSNTMVLALDPNVLLEVRLVADVTTCFRSSWRVSLKHTGRQCVCATLVTLKWKYANMSGYWFHLQRLLHAQVIIEALVIWVSVVALPSALRTVYVTYFVNEKFSRKTMQYFS